MKFLILNILAVSTLLSACGTSNICILQPLIKPILIDTITVNHQSIKTNNIFDMKVSIVKVSNDSRCPTNVTCKWGGNAEVLLKVKHPNKKDYTFTLNTNQKFKTEVEINGYNYKLIKLNPYPKKHFKSILQLSYKAKIIIEKK